MLPLSGAIGESPSRMTTRASYTDGTPRALAEEAWHGDRLESPHRSGRRQEGCCALLRRDLRLEMRARRLLRAGTGERADDAAVRRHGRVPKSSLRLSRE